MTNKFDSRKNVIWSVDLKYNEANGPAKYPLYEIVTEGIYYSIKYHGVSEIRKEYDLDRAKTWIREQLAPYKEIRRTAESLYGKLKMNAKRAYWGV